MIDRWFRNWAHQESIKLHIKIQRSKRFKRQHIPVRFLIEDRYWELGVNRFRKHPRYPR